MQDRPTSLPAPRGVIVISSVSPWSAAARLGARRPEAAAAAAIPADAQPTAQAPALEPPLVGTGARRGRGWAACRSAEPLAARRSGLSAAVAALRVGDSSCSVEHGRAEAGCSRTIAPPHPFAGRGGLALQSWSSASKARTTHTATSTHTNAQSSLAADAPASHALGGIACRSARGQGGALRSLEPRATRTGQAGDSKRRPGAQRQRLNERYSHPPPLLFSPPAEARPCERTRRALRHVARAVAQHLCCPLTLWPACESPCWESSSSKRRSRAPRGDKRRGIRARTRR